MFSNCKGNRGRPPGFPWTLFVRGTAGEEARVGASACRVGGVGWGEIIVTRGVRAGD
jgi:hypothetical protein